MNNPTPQKPAPKAEPSEVRTKKSTISDLKPLLTRSSKKFSKHAAFAGLLIVLLAYLVVVYKISSLSKAEPSPDQTSNTASLIPKIDPKAISQIQSLEDNNTQVHTLFEQARNNPFSE